MKNFVFKRSSGSFISLEDFLAQEDPHRIHYMTGRQFLCYYQLAKASYLQFGEGGPPVGAKVITYFAGHGGMGHNTRIFGGQNGNSSDYFELTDPYASKFPSPISLSSNEKFICCPNIIMLKLRRQMIPLLIHNNETYKNGGYGVSLVEKDAWWRHIAPIDPEIKDFGGLPSFLTKKLRYTELETMIAFVCGR